MKRSGTAIDQISKEIPGIVLLSHGPLAGGILGSLNLVYGDVENVTAFELEEGDDPEKYRECFAETYEAMPERSIFLIDIFGGTPSNQTLKYFLTAGKEIRAICGMNLGMLMEAVAERDSEEDFLEQMEAVGQECIKNIGNEWKNQMS